MINEKSAIDLKYIEENLILKKALDFSIEGEEINIATQSEISISDLAQKLIDKINPNAKIVSDEQRIRPEKSEVNRLFGSNQKINELTNWKQKYSIEKGLKETIAWFGDKNNLKQYKHDIYNI